MCCIFNALDGTDDDTLQKDNKQNKNVSSKCEDDEGTVCGDGHPTDNDNKQSDSDR